MELNKNLKQIEKALKIKVIQNGTEFNISGNQDDVEMGVSALFDLKQKLETKFLLLLQILFISACILLNFQMLKKQTQKKFTSKHQELL